MENTLLWPLGAGFSQKAQKKKLPKRRQTRSLVESMLTFSNTQCSAWAPITWHVDRKCHKISASSFDKTVWDID